MNEEALSVLKASIKYQDSAIERLRDCITALETDIAERTKELRDYQAFRESLLVTIAKLESGS